MHNAYIFEKKIEIHTVKITKSHLFLHRKISHNYFFYLKKIHFYEFFSHFYSFEITNI